MYVFPTYIGTQYNIIQIKDDCSVTTLVSIITGDCGILDVLEFSVLGP